MTEQLKTLMRAQADSVDFATPDLDAMVRTGDRRRRARRLGAVGAVAAAVAGVAVLATSLTAGQRAVEPAGAPPAAAPLTWVDGSTLHEEGRTTDLGFHPVAYVRTAAGYVLADRDGRVWSWQDGERSLAGTTDAGEVRLVGDDETGLAGWVSRDGSEYVVMDQRRGTITGYTAPSRTQPSDFAALDAGAAYWRGTEGPVVVDLASGDETAVEGLDRDRDLGDLEDGLLATPVRGGVVVRDLAGEVLSRLPEVYSDYGSLSPDGRYYTSDADQPQVFDVRTGERVAFDLGARGFASGYEWLGGGTLAMIAAQDPSDGAAQVELLRCTVRDSACDQAAVLMSFDEATGRLVLPVGLPIDG